MKCMIEAAACFLSAGSGGAKAALQVEVVCRQARVWAGVSQEDGRGSAPSTAFHRFEIQRERVTW